MADIRHAFGWAEALLAGRTPTGVQDGEELYLLSAEGCLIGERFGSGEVEAHRHP